MVLIARPILQERCTGIAEGGLRTRSLEYWNGLERVRRLAPKDVVVLAPPLLHVTWRFDSWPGLRRLLDLVRAEKEYWEQLSN